MHPVDDILLRHGEEPYNAAKAREYYLRNRKLKGRRPAGVEVSVGRIGSKSESPAEITRRKEKQNWRVKPTSKMSSKEIKTRTAELKSRLEGLRKTLALLVKQAKARSGVVEKTPEEKAKEKATATKKQSNLTPQEKAKAAKASKEAYDKEQKKSGPNEMEDLKKKINEVCDKLTKVRAEIALAKQKTQKKNAGSVGVSNDR